MSRWRLWTRSSSASISSLIFAERASSSPSACIWRVRSATSVATVLLAATSSAKRFSCSMTAASVNFVPSSRFSAAAISVLSLLTSATSGTRRRLQRADRVELVLRVDHLRGRGRRTAVLSVSSSARRASCSSSLRSTSALRAFRPFRRPSSFSTNGTRALTREICASSSATDSCSRVAFCVPSSTSFSLPRIASIFASSSGAAPRTPSALAERLERRRRSAPSLSRSFAASACDL